MKRLSILVLSLSACFSAWSQSYSDQFYDALNRDDIPLQRSILDDWSLASPDDVDLYIARYNYYINSSAMLDNDSPEKPPQFSQSVADSALSVIEEGISRYPKRLDMRFGKIFFLGELQRWEAFADESIRMLNRSELMEHQWIFPNVEEGFEELITESIQDYLSTLSGHLSGSQSHTPQDTLIISCMRRIAQRTVQVFPSDIQAVRSLALTCLMTHEYESALKYLKRAEKMDPTDEWVVDNLAAVKARLNKKKGSR